MTVRAVFMGSPEFALPSLRSLAGIAQVVGVVTQPDRPAGRGRALTPPPVKELALELGLPVIQPRRLREAEAMQQLREWAPEVIVVTAFGQILRPEVLDLPRFGCVNVHASLLPRWRGAAPIQAALLAGDENTGSTIMVMDPGIDTGPILAQQAVPILPGDTAGSLGPRLAQEGADLLVKTLPRYLSGEIIPMPQDAYPGGEPTYAPMLTKEDGRLDFSRPAEELERRVRALSPWPGAFFDWQGQTLKVHQARVIPADALPPGFPCGSSDLPGGPTRPGSRTPGTTVVYQGLPAVTACPGLLLLEEVQPAGKKPMPGDVFLRGARGWEGV
jgi:methionyl-tRNA formyltransferase